MEAEEEEEEEGGEVSSDILLCRGPGASDMFLWRFVNMYQEYSLFFVRPCLASCNVLLMNIDT